MFHFNKGHLADETIPMWVVKAHGVTFYVNHVISDMPWSTKETPGNEKTKGSIKFKKCKLSIDTEDNTATISRLGIADAWLRHPERRAGRIIFPYGGKMHKALSEGEFEHSKFKNIEGSCGSEYIICDLRDEQELTFAGIKYATYFRILAPNEHYYQAYDSGNTIWEQEEDEDE